MNIQEYISSGIVESYVLGLADASEREEFERMCAMHSEVKEARDTFEISLEEYTLMNQLKPSRNVKSKIFASIDIEADQQKVLNPDQQAKAPVSIKRRWAVGAPPKLVAMRSWPRYLAVASIILLLVSIGLNFYFFSRYRDYNNRYQALVQSQLQLASRNEVLQTRITEYRKAVNLMKDPYMAIVKMPAIPKGPDSSSMTTVYWDTVSKDVYLVVNHLPTPSETQQYQLWALVDGKTIDAGMIDLSSGSTVAKMKNIPKADAFAITLEKKGGSPTPNLQQLFVMGKV